MKQVQHKLVPWLGGDLGTGKAFSLTGYLFALSRAERQFSWLVISRSLVQIAQIVQL